MSKAMHVAGVMSGTSADGIDVALVRIAATADGSKIRFLHHQAFPYTGKLRHAVLAAMDAKAISAAEMARLNWRLGQAYAEAVRATLKRHPVRLDLVGCHGQTVYHQGSALPYLGRKVACTLQLGEAALVAAEMQVPVVSNFRPADMAAGGQGAPLVPLLDFVQFRHRTRARVLQNIGGIGNLSAIPAGGHMGQVLAFDTGPGNMVIDALMQALYGKSYDRGGGVARQGRVLNEVITRELGAKYFRMRPPKSAGREEFGAVYAQRFLTQCQRLSKTPADAIATATALTARSIARSYRAFVPQPGASVATDYLVSGGGAKNRTLMQMLAAELEPMGCRVRPIEDAGFPAQAKEAIAFALLAYQTWHHRPGNVPSATGADRPAILGEVTYV